MRVASKVGNLHSEFGHAKPLGSRVIRYVRDGRTDRRMDGQTQSMLPLPYGWGYNNVTNVYVDRFRSCVPHSVTTELYVIILCRVTKIFCRVTTLQTM